MTYSREKFLCNAAIAFDVDRNDRVRRTRVYMCPRKRRAMAVNGVPCSGNVLTLEIGTHCGGRLSSTFEASLSCASQCLDEKDALQGQRAPLAV